jgi:heat shock protein 4
VSFGEKERAVGVAAKNQLVTNRKNTIWGWKKFLGRPFNDPQVQQELPKLSYDVVQGPEGSTGIKVLLICKLSYLIDHLVLR